MALTFRSSTPDRLELVDRDSRGNQRVIRATLQDNGRQWACEIAQPSGVRPCSPVYGGRGEAAAALAHYLAETSVEWQQEKNRGFKPEVRMRRDTNVPLDEFGNSLSAAIIPRR